MGKIGKPEKGSTVARAVKAVCFAKEHRSFSIGDLADELGIHKNNAKSYLDALCLHMPIVELKPARYSLGGFGRMAALYGIAKNNQHSSF